MTDENPFAAPQTVDRALPVAKLSPLLRGTERILYLETDTGELSRLAYWSTAIDHLSLWWAVLCCFSAAALLISFSAGMAPYPWYWGLAFLLLSLRLWGNYRRSPGAWKYTLGFDALAFSGGVFASIYTLVMSWEFFLLFAIPFSGFLFATGKSVVAHLMARSLFGQYTHRDLLHELSYRLHNFIP